MVLPRECISVKHNEMAKEQYNQCCNFAPRNPNGSMIGSMKSKNEIGFRQLEIPRTLNGMKSLVHDMGLMKDAEL
jgi:hypothetical protein